LQEEDEEETGLPVTHDSLRLVEQVKTIAEQRIYLDEDKELFTLLTNMSLQVSPTSSLFCTHRLAFFRMTS
jgi:hypothetical protein